MKIPALILKQLYTFGSLESGPSGLTFAIKNRLSDATLTGISELKINDTPLDLGQLRFDLGDGEMRRATELSPDAALPFPLHTSLQVHVEDHSLPAGKHEILLVFNTKPFGRLELAVEDAISDHEPERPSVPYTKQRHRGPDTVNVHRRQHFVKEITGVELEHVSSFSFDAQTTRGNIENFTGVSQVPLGFAGPLQVNGEHARGEFIIPLATTEGTLVASYNRGIKCLNRSRRGDLHRRRRPHAARAGLRVRFGARGARVQGAGSTSTSNQIREAAEATSSVAKLTYIDTFLSNKLRLPALQLHAPATRRGRTWSAARPSPPAAGSSSAWTTCASSTSSPTWPRTRRPRRSTSCAPGASGSPPRRRSRADVLVEQHARRAGEPGLPLQRGQRRGVSLRRQQQRLPLAERDHGDVHRHGQDVANVAESVGGHRPRRD